ncbi:MULTISPECIES: sensor of ECF-type sigma factor [unclassified Polaribacter]|uniref:sensor of ECF-type sigma factor n=1 Tax=unclassified Polaribacter TaxID=196858 RepID=UPI0011BD61E3|nr:MULTISPECIES: sensor of ECF-type sigma factor [unclassified Polaribacter]TXD52576.1 sensor of ECF-type sigma factor [Polaribacter sp. IC063]TXD56775.1 sensor of ECF-type sigma factor [Polaribacter sp. IC066]
MKKFIIIGIISLFCTIPSTAQGKKEGREKIKTLKIAYITEQLQLTTGEAQKFWPVYNAYDEEQHSLRRSYRFTLKQAIKENESIDKLSENESKKLISLKLSTDKKLNESQEDFTKKIAQIISANKIIKLQIAEIEFGRNLMRKYKHKKSDSKN